MTDESHKADLLLGNDDNDGAEFISAFNLSTALGGSMDDTKPLLGCSFSIAGELGAEVLFPPTSYFDAVLLKSIFRCFLGGEPGGVPNSHSELISNPSSPLSL